MYKQKNSLFSNFVIVVSAFVILLVTIFIYRIHSVESRVHEQELENIAEKINHHFIESVNHTENVLSYVGRQISSNNEPRNYKYILDSVVTRYIFVL